MSPIRKNVVNSVQYYDIFHITALMLKQNGHQWADNISQWIFFSENVWILITISQPFFPNDSIDNTSELFHVIAYLQTGNKSLPESPESMLTKMSEAVTS